ncbi:hypothetical protein SSPIM334S_02744 [Streptomyces spiroverticillatus]
MVWKIPTLAVGETEELKITAQVTEGAKGAKLRNSAEVTEGPDPEIPDESKCKDDPTKICDTDGDGSEVKEPKLTLTKTQLPAQAQVGNTLTYTVKMANAAGADVLPSARRWLTFFRRELTWSRSSRRSVRSTPPRSPR